MRSRSEGPRPPARYAASSSGVGHTSTSRPEPGSGGSDFGDLTPFFEGFHDTTTGPKQEAASYRAIASAFDLPPEAILFLSDVRGELDAAAEAGMKTGMLVRPGNRPADPGAHSVYTSFEKLA